MGESRVSCCSYLYRTQQRDCCASPVVLLLHCLRKDHHVQVLFGVNRPASNDGEGQTKISTVAIYLDRGIWNPTETMYVIF
jgi:hypothetical protein